MKSIKLKEYFQIVKPTYAYLKLTPHNSIRNYSSDKIAKTIASLYQNLTQKIVKYEDSIKFYCPLKVSYYIYIEKTKAEFYFIVPEVYLPLFQEKIGDTWKGITITRVYEIPSFDPYCVKYALKYQKEDALSLSIDKRTNTLLSSLLNVINVIEDGDRLGVFYNFTPYNQFTWHSRHQSTIKKYESNLPIERQKINWKYALKLIAALIFECISIATEVISDTEPKKENEGKILNLKELSKTTISKRDETVVDTQILVLSESKNILRNKNNAISLCAAYSTVTEDNRLQYKQTKVRFDPLLHNIGVEKNKMSTKEIQNLIALPGKELLEEYKMIEKIDTFESEVPKELRNGVVCIGDNTYRGKVQKAYLSDDRVFKFCTLVIIGPTRAGKTTLISNISNDTIKNNECTILFDFCGNCDLSNDVLKVVRRSLVIDCSDFDTLQGLGYNEVTPTNNNPFEIYRCAKTKTSQLMTLIDTVNNDDSELRARMSRFLEAAAVVVFISNGAIKDVFTMLQDHRLRKKYIDMIPDHQQNNLVDYVLTLQELDDIDRRTGELLGTKISITTGILNRINKLKQNTYMELMLKHDCGNNIDLVKEMQKPQLICIKMPELMFSTETETDIYCTYWLTKIWGALQKRKWDYPDDKDRVKVNIVFDELYQVPFCQDYLRKKLSQIAKFSGKPIISCHYLGQIGKIRNELKAANSSYMLLAGCDKDNYKELKEELYPYEVEDLLHLKTHHSLNYIKTSDGYGRFITKLPKPL